MKYDFGFDTYEMVAKEEEIEFRALENDTDDNNFDDDDNDFDDDDDDFFDENEDDELDGDVSSVKREYGRLAGSVDENSDTE